LRGGRKRDNLLTPNGKERIRALLDHDAKGCLNIGCSMGRQRLEA
jgi:hypothetical protein